MPMPRHTSSKAPCVWNRGQRAGGAGGRVVEAAAVREGCKGQPGWGQARADPGAPLHRHAGNPDSTGARTMQRFISLPLSLITSAGMSGANDLVATIVGSAVSALPYSFRELKPHRWYARSPDMVAAGLCGRVVGEGGVS
jgi:hypothetical protein